MKVALLGARGQLGSDLVKTCPETIGLVAVSREILDITDENQVRSRISGMKPDWVIHAAAFVNVDAAEDNPPEAFRVNAVATRNIAEACQEAKAGLVYISTDFVFDGKKEPVPYDETDAPNPLNTYGLSKYAGEIYARNILEKLHVVRSSSLYGRSGSKSKGGNFVSAILRKAGNKEKIQVINDIRMSPTYTRDAAREIWKLIFENRAYGIHHVVNSGTCSWHEFAEKILEASGLKAALVPVPHTAYPEKARRPLWSPLVSKQGIRMRRWDEALNEFVNTCTSS